MSKDQLEFVPSYRVNEGYLEITTGYDGGEVGLAEAAAAPNLPGDLAEYPHEESRAYALSVTAAVKAGLPVLEVSGGSSRSVVVLERVAYLALPKPDGSEDHYGYAIRLCVTVNKLEGSISLKLPVLAASAELGRIEAQWKLSVTGLAGVKISKAILPPETLDVETFVVARQSLSSVIDAVRDESTRFQPQLVARIPARNQLEQRANEAIGSATALEALRRGKPISWLEQQLVAHPASSLNAAHELYRGLAGDLAEDQTAPSEARQLATRYLQGIRIKVDSDWI